MKLVQLLRWLCEDVLCALNVLVCHLPQGKRGPLGLQLLRCQSRRKFLSVRDYSHARSRGSCGCGSRDRRASLTVVVRIGLSIAVASDVFIINSGVPRISVCGTSPLRDVQLLSFLRWGGAARLPACRGLLAQAAAVGDACEALDYVAVFRPLLALRRLVAVQGMVYLQRRGVCGESTASLQCERHHIHSISPQQASTRCNTVHHRLLNRSRGKTLVTWHIRPH